MTPDQARATAAQLRADAVTMQSTIGTNLTNASLLEKWADIMDVANGYSFTAIMPNDVIAYYQALAATPAPAPDAQPAGPTAVVQTGKPVENVFDPGLIVDTKS